jgi:hypothetical protein
VISTAWNLGCGLSFGTSDTPLMGVSIQLEFPIQFLGDTPLFGIPAQLVPAPAVRGSNSKRYSAMNVPVQISSASKTSSCLLSLIFLAAASVY